MVTANTSVRTHARPASTNVVIMGFSGPIVSLGRTVQGHVLGCLRQTSGASSHASLESYRNPTQAEVGGGNCKTLQKR
jgi:hypothetical protein